MTPAYALLWKNPRTGIASLCEVEGGTIYELGTRGAMEASAERQNDQVHPDMPTQFWPVALPFAGELPDHFQPTPIPPATVSQNKLFIEDDYGTEVCIRLIRSESFLGLRRAIRELNPGTIPIYSDYDCTGQVCGQRCKIVYLHNNGYTLTAVVEISTTRDV